MTTERLKSLAIVNNTRNQPFSYDQIVKKIIHTSSKKKGKFTKYLCASFLELLVQNVIDL